MGAYTFLSDSDFVFYTIVTDRDMMEALTEVRSVMPEWYIEERFEYHRNWYFKKTETVRYTVYHRQKEDYSEVRIQMSACTKYQVLNLLYGLYMGYHKAKEDEATKAPQVK